MKYAEITVLVLAGALMTNVQAADTKADGARYAAQQYAKAVIPKLLKNPDSAKFPWEEIKVASAADLRNGNEGVSVVGVCRATNGFNAVVSNNWEVVLQSTGDGWDLLVLSYDGRVVVETDAYKELKEAARIEQMNADLKAERAIELEQWYARGYDLGEKTAERFGRNVRTASKTIIEKAYAKAGDDLTHATPEEIERFRGGFDAALQAAGRR